MAHAVSHLLQFTIKITTTECLYLMCVVTYSINYTTRERICINRCSFDVHGYVITNDSNYDVFGQNTLGCFFQK